RRSPAGRACRAFAATCSGLRRAPNARPRVAGRGRRKGSVVLWNALRGGWNVAAMIPGRIAPPMHSRSRRPPMFEYDQARLREIAEAVLAFAREFGASSAAVDVSENSGLSVNV